MLVPLFRVAIRPPKLSTVQGTRTLLFRPPATPSNCQGFVDEAHVFPTLPRKRKPLIFDREGLRASAHSLRSFPTYLHFCYLLVARCTLRLCHAPVPFPSRRYTNPKTESKAVTLKDDPQTAVTGLCPDSVLCYLGEYQSLLIHAYDS